MTVLDVAVDAGAGATAQLFAELIECDVLKSKATHLMPLALTCAEATRKKARKERAKNYIIMLKSGELACTVSSPAQIRGKVDALSRSLWLWLTLSQEA